jgi:hypothetical protein
MKLSGQFEIGLSLPDRDAGSSRTVAIPTSKHVRIPEIPVRDQIDALYQAAEHDGTLWSTQESTCRSWTPVLGLLEATGRLVPSQADCLGVPEFGEQLHGCSRDAGLGGQVVRCPKNRRSAAAIVSGLP